jgi:hypothetical protein
MILVGDMVGSKYLIYLNSFARESTFLIKKPYTFILNKYLNLIKVFKATYNQAFKEYDFYFSANPTILFCTFATNPTILFRVFTTNPTIVYSFLLINIPDSIWNIFFLISKSDLYCDG